jgi:hypothetical protein
MSEEFNIKIDLKDKRCKIMYLAAIRKFSSGFFNAVKKVIFE